MSNYKKLIIRLIIISVVLFSIGYMIAWALHSYVMADYNEKVVLYSSQDLKVNDEPKNDFGNTNHYQVQPTATIFTEDELNNSDPFIAGCLHSGQTKDNCETLKEENTVIDADYVKAKPLGCPHAEMIPADDIKCVLSL